MLHLRRTSCERKFAELACPVPKLTLLPFDSSSATVLNWVQTVPAPADPPHQARTRARATGATRAGRHGDLLRQPPRTAIRAGPKIGTLLLLVEEEATVEPVDGEGSASSAAAVRAGVKTKCTRTGAVMMTGTCGIGETEEGHETRGIGIAVGAGVGVRRHRGGVGMTMMTLAIIGGATRVGRIATTRTNDMQTTTGDEIGAGRGTIEGLLARRVRQTRRGGEVTMSAAQMVTRARGTREIWTAGMTSGVGSTEARRRSRPERSRSRCRIESLRIAIGAAFAAECCASRQDTPRGVVGTDPLTALSRTLEFAPRCSAIPGEGRRHSLQMTSLHAVGQVE